MKNDSILLFEKEYDYESLYDLERDIHECIEDQDQDNLEQGTIKVSITFESD